MGQLHTAEALVAPPASSGGTPGGTAGGDLSGTYPNPTVAKLRGKDVKEFDAAETLADNFNDSSLDTGKWVRSVLTSDCQEANGRLEIRNVNHVSTVLTSIDFTNRWAVMEAPQTNNTLWRMLFTAFPADQEEHQFNRTSGGLLKFQKRTASSTTDVASITYNATTHRWWKFEHKSSDGKLYYYTSPDGVTWTEQASVAPVQAVTGGVRLRFFGLDATTHSHFDNFSSNIAASTSLANGDSLVYESAQSKFVNLPCGQIPTVTADPSAAPSVIAGLAPARFNTTNHKLWIWNPVAGAWKSVTLA